MNLVKPILDIITITKDDLEGIVATINSTRSLRECPGVRQIIVDSSDEATSIHIKRTISGERNIWYLWQAPSGISPAFNAGLALSDSEWVWFINGRDQLHPGLKLPLFLDIIAATYADVLIFELEFLQSRTRCFHPPLSELWPPVRFWIPHPATLVRRKLFEMYGCFDETYEIAMDGELWFRFLSKQILVDMISFPISLFDEEGISRLRSDRTARESIRVIIRNLPVILKYWVRNGYSTIRMLWMFHKRSRGRN